jgi:hypothetical protein
MRTTLLKIGNEKKEAILVAGGAGFKIYSSSGVQGWIIVLGRRVFVIEENSSDFATVSRYINLKYQPLNQQEAIKAKFGNFIKQEIIKHSDLPINSTP